MPSTQRIYKIQLVVLLMIIGIGIAQKQDVLQSSLVPIQFLKAAAISRPDQVKRDSEMLDLTSESESGKRCTDQKEVLDWAPQYRDFEKDLKEELKTKGLTYIALRKADGDKIQIFKVTGEYQLYGFWMHLNAGLTSQGIRFPFTRLAWCVTK